ncbi:MAG: hypothetical protein Q9187_006782 [Circinaria calcarea]
MLHLNLPAPKDGRWTIFWRRTRWLLLGIPAPELLMTFAFAQWSSAKRSRAEMRSLGNPDSKWTMVHAFYADMGGFLLCTPDAGSFPITARQLKYLIRRGYLSLPDISKEEIWDKSKADKVAKILAILQTSWLGTQTLARAIQGLPITPLELFTLAVALNSLTTLWLWLNKPLDVGSPTVLTIQTNVATILVQAGHTAKEPFCDTPLDFIEPGIYQSRSWNETLLRWIVHQGIQSRPIHRIPNDRDWLPLNLSQNLALALPVSIFASIHFCGWNFSFPTYGELILWRAAVSVIWSLLLVYGTSEVVLFWKSKYTKTSLEIGGAYKRNWPWSLLFHVPATVYFCLRVLLMIEVVVSLRSLPEKAFVNVRWSGFIPHF